MPTILTPPEIRGVIQEANVATLDVDLLDDLYALPSEIWLREVFFTNLKFVQDQLGVYTYEETVNDCDDFGRFCSAYARLLHARTKERPPGTALAVGDMCYYSVAPSVTDSGRKHYINLAICKVDDKLVVLFIEPQLPGFVKLTPEQLENVVYVRI